MFYPSLIGTAGVSSVARQAQSDARDAKTELEFVKHDIERLLMITEALWMLLKKEHGYEDSELTKMISQIDLRDGKLDGRVARTAPQRCPYCARPVSQRRSFCIFCGKAIPAEIFGR